MKEKLQAVYDLLEKGWTKGVYAKDAEGGTVFYSSPRATSFCLAGACFRVDYPAYDLINFLSDNRINLAGFNDSHDKEQVLEFVRSAISRAS